MYTNFNGRPLYVNTIAIFIDNCNRVTLPRINPETVTAFSVFVRRLLRLVKGRVPFLLTIYGSKTHTCNYNTHTHANEHAKIQETYFFSF